MPTTSFTFPVDLSEDECGFVLAVIPDVPGCATDGRSREDALAAAADALEEALARIIGDRGTLPSPSPKKGRPGVAPGALIAAKAALYDAMREQGISNTELARRLGCVESEVRRMLDPRHATKITRLEQALKAVGRQLLVAVEAA